MRFVLTSLAAILLATLTPLGLGFAQSPTRTRLITSPNPSSFGVTLTAEVDGLGGGAPTGKVSFSDGATQLAVAGLRVLGAGQTTLSAGDYHNCGLTDVGGLTCWGWNQFGQLGDGTTTNRGTPVAVTGLASGVVAVAAGDRHTCALTSAGGVKCWGWNAFGELGDGTKTDRRTPVDVVGLTSGAIAVTANGAHTCALTRAGGVKCWGYNAYGQLGDGTQTDRPTPVDVVGLSSRVVGLSIGGYHSCALTRIGVAKCWGRNDEGQLGAGSKSNPLLKPVTTLKDVAAVASGWLHSCALTRAGGAKCWGYNAAGEIGDGTNDGRPYPVDVVGLSTGVAAVSAGAYHSCALSQTGGVKCWGANRFGALGNGATFDRASPVAVIGLSSGVTGISAGGWHSCALVGTGVAQCWGDNNFRQIGVGDRTNRFKPTPTRFTGLVRARARANLSPGMLSLGQHTLRATYAGDAAHGGSSDSTTQWVDPQ